MNIDARIESKLQNASLRFVRPPSASGWSPSTFAKRRAHRHQRARHANRCDRRTDELARRAQPVAIRRRVLHRSAGARRALPPSDCARAVCRCRARVAARRRSRRAHAGMDRARAGRRRHSRCVDAQLRARDPALRVLAADQSPMVVHARAPKRASCSRRSRNDIPVGAAVSNRRRHDGARLRVREPRHQAGRRGAADALLLRDERRGDALDRRSVGYRGVRRRRQCVRRSRRRRGRRVGYGIGARVKTPIGPFRLDVAYGESRDRCGSTSPSASRFRSE